MRRSSREWRGPGELSKSQHSELNITTGSDKPSVCKELMNVRLHTSCRNFEGESRKSGGHEEIGGGEESGQQKWGKA